VEWSLTSGSTTLVHSNAPDDDKGYEERGWEDNYFTPMKEYFGKKGQR
jgi:hypothetical protein